MSGVSTGDCSWSHLHINDITTDIETEMRLFAHDCVCYHEIKDKEDTLKLQRETDPFGNWGNLCQHRRYIAIRYTIKIKKDASSLCWRCAWCALCVYAAVGAGGMLFGHWFPPHIPCSSAHQISL